MSKPVVFNNIFYNAIFPELSKTALSKGYKLALYGDPSTTVDLIAVPWLPDPYDGPILIDALYACLKKSMILPDGYHALTITPKPRIYGQLLWSIPLGSTDVLNITVIPYQTPALYAPT